MNHDRDHFIAFVMTVFVVFETPSFCDLFQNSYCLSNIGSFGYELLDVPVLSTTSSSWSEQATLINTTRTIAAMVLMDFMKDHLISTVIINTF